jgi:hypothetical protein
MQNTKGSRYMLNSRIRQEPRLINPENRMAIEKKIEASRSNGFLYDYFSLYLSCHFATGF